MVRLLRRLLRLGRDERGSPTLEFAFAAPVLFQWPIGMLSDRMDRRTVLVASRTP